MPYGISNYKEIINLNAYYVDKTKYIELLEQRERYLFFVRPRRFGKSLFVSMLETYYDIHEKENFDKYFGSLYIGQNKTKDANKYLILKLDFSTVITEQGSDMIIKSFDEKVVNSVSSFMQKYKDIYKKDLPQDKNNAIFALEYLISQTKLLNKQIYMLIDEYDNFANNIMSSDKENYESLMHKGGYVRTFYKTIKFGTGEGVITKAFITGVTPIMLDDVTSGANMFTQLALNENFNSMLGLTEEEIEKIIKSYKLDKITDTKELKKTLRIYCDGYKFNKESKKGLYNTDMAIYILKSLVQDKKYPDEIIDANIKTDYKRLRNIAEKIISKEELVKIIEKNEIGELQIKERFNLESLYDETEAYTNTRSLLYYLGMLTISGKEENGVTLKIPNIAIRELYFEYITKIYNVEATVKYDKLKSAMKEMRLNKNLQPILEQYKLLLNNLSNNDLKDYDELTSKILFISLLYMDGIYLLESERQANGGRTDLYVKENFIYKEHVKYRYIIEFKHIKMSEIKGDAIKETKEEILAKNKDKIESLKKEAQKQIDEYIKDYNVINDSEKELEKCIIITIGQKYVLHC